jgi:hypothetical protein
MISSAIISKFTYRLNVGRSDGGIIPLGAMALLKDDAGAESTLVLIARRELKPSERTQMDWAAAHMLANPLEFLKKQVDEALSDRVASDVLDRLSQKFAWSIYASPPTLVVVPPELATQIQEALDVLTAPVRQAPASKGRKRIIPSAFAAMAGPEFHGASMEAYAPPAWMLPHVGTSAYRAP